MKHAHGRYASYFLEDCFGGVQMEWLGLIDGGGSDEVGDVVELAGK